MPFLAENGTGLAGATSLCSVEFADSYFEDRNVTKWTGTDTVKEAALIRATDYVEARWQGKWRGDLQTATQALSFPRTGIGHDSAVPGDILKAVAEYALRTLDGTPLAPDPVYDATGFALRKAREKVGPIETEYEHIGSSPETLRPYPAADMLIRPFVYGGGGRLLRA